MSRPVVVLIALAHLTCTPTLPSAPAAPTLTRHDRDRVTILPNPPPNGQSGVGVSYQLRRGAPGQAKTTLFAVEIGVPVEDTLPSGATAYVVVATSAGGEASSPEAIVSGPPAKPTGLHFSAIDETSVTIEWDRDPAVTGWASQWASEPGLASSGRGYGNLRDTVSEPKLVLGRGQKMYLAVIARNDVGDSPFSDEILYDPAAPPVLDPPDGGSDPVLPPPIDVHVAPADGAAVVTWRFDGDAPTNVRLYLDGAPFVTLGVSDSGARINDLQNDRAYTLEISSLNPPDEGPRSAAVRFVPRRFVGMAGQNSHFCAVTSAGVPYCWGTNTKGELGTTPGTRPGAPVRPGLLDTGGATLPMTGVTQLAVGLQFSCAIIAGGEVACWGENASGQRGDAGSVQPQGVGSRVLVGSESRKLTNVSSIGAGRAHACALAADGVWCWGDHTFKQLGRGAAFTSSSSPAAERVVGTEPGGAFAGALELAVGDYNTCLRLSDNHVACWGSELMERDSGGATVAATHLEPTLKAVAGTPITASRLFNTSYGSCIEGDSGFQCWGSGTFTPGNVLENGSLTNGTGAPEPTGVPLRAGGSLANVVAMSWSWRQACALTNAATLWCWGDNARSLPGGDRQLWPVPFADGAGLTQVKQVAAGDGVTCVIDRLGRLRCRGRNEDGQCGTLPGTSCADSPDVPFPE